MTTPYLFSPPGEEPGDDAVTLTQADLAPDPLAVLTRNLDLLQNEVSRGLLKLDSTASEMTWVVGRLNAAFAQLASLTVRLEALEAHTTALRRLVERNASEWR